MRQERHTSYRNRLRDRSHTPQHPSAVPCRCCCSDVYPDSDRSFRNTSSCRPLLTRSRNHRQESSRCKRNPVCPPEASSQVQPRRSCRGLKKVLRKIVKAKAQTWDNFLLLLLASPMRRLPQRDSHQKHHHIHTLLGLAASGSDAPKILGTFNPDCNHCAS